MAENQKGTFIVKINHTDNASWQGQVTWADKNITKNFRSTLELIKLMDGAITSEEDKRRWGTGIAGQDNRPQRQYAGRRRDTSRKPYQSVICKYLSGRIRPVY